MALSSNNRPSSFGGPALLLSHPTFPSFNSLCLANDKSSYEQLAFSEIIDHWVKPINTQEIGPSLDGLP
ncbi:hypothetical protein HNY73_001125 [Argiope bruennichi]|uniref:Uncharacterized protein n=1 Tax=Argiope bruennichi TaxID=94029 RepID=A0A8T0G2R4_ARGBR|nr:hypothetical protein HNY73_001125 [Argiope bruennichi]